MHSVLKMLSVTVIVEFISCSLMAVYYWRCVRVIVSCTHNYAYCAKDVHTDIPVHICCTKCTQGYYTNSYAQTHTCSLYTSTLHSHALTLGFVIDELN